MKRRHFVRLVCGAAVACPALLHGQAPNRMRRVGVLMNLAEADPQSQTQIAAFLQGLQDVGWSAGRNVQIDYRWTEGNVDKIRRYGSELVALAPDVILPVGASHVGPLQ